MAGTREENVYMAKLAEQAERYEEMVEFMEKVTATATANGDDLTDEERRLLSLAYKKVIDPRKESLGIISSIPYDEESDSNEDRVAVIRRYLSKIESELSSICDGVLRLLDSSLIPSASTAESKVFYLKMKGDYHCYLAEFKINTDREEAVESTHAAYSSAQDIALAELEPAHSVRLGLALNFAVFYSEILNSPERAINLARQAFDDALSAIDTVGEEHYKESVQIMQLLDANLTLWTSDMKGDNIDEIKATSHEDK